MDDTRFRLPAGASLRIVRADITGLAVDAIVNAADERMLGGGGVDGAIHRAAGPALLAACRAHEEVSPGVRCPTGTARLTPGFALPAAHVIHTVGPIYAGPEVSAPLLAAAYRSALTMAASEGFETVAFPAISCGVYGYPLSEAAEIAIDTCMESSSGIEGVVFALFSVAAEQAWLAAARARLPSLH